MHYNIIFYVQFMQPFRYTGENVECGEIYLISSGKIKFIREVLKSCPYISIPDFKIKSVSIESSISTKTVKGHSCMDSIKSPI